MVRDRAVVRTVHNPAADALTIRTVTIGVLALARRRGHREMAAILEHAGAR